MYIKTIDDYLVNMHAGRTIVPYMMKEFDKRGIDTSDMKAMTDYLKYDDAEEANIFNDAWDAQMNDDIDAGLWDKMEEEVDKAVAEGKTKTISEMKSVFGDMIRDSEHREKQINESRRKRLARSW